MNSLFCLLFFLSLLDRAKGSDDKTLPICTKSTEQAIHVGVLPPAGNDIDLELSLDKQWPASSEFELYHCAIQLEACSSCGIGVSFEPVIAHFSEFQMEKFSKCDEMSTVLEPCFNLEFVEESADQSGTSTNGFSLDNTNIYRRKSIWDKPDSNHYNSSANSLKISLTMRNLASENQLFHYILQNFPMKVHVYSNEVVIRGSSINSTSRLNRSSSTGYINLPRYPSAYPTTIIQNFTLENKNASGFVRLTFDDFHINHRSLLQIIDGEEVIFDSRTSQNRRPRSIQSSSRSLRLTFAANYFTNQIGFKAKYEFVDSDKWLDRPINCDELLENYGGRLSLNNRDALVGTNVDCIWVVSQAPSFARIFNHIYLRVEEYQLKGRLQFEIRRGAYSEAERILMLFENQTTNQLIRKQPASGFIIDSKDVHSGFYIRLKGFLASTTGLSVVYTQFFTWSGGICPAEDEFYCSNSRCIKKALHCDGFNHCGDGFDEICHVQSNMFEESHIDISALLALVVGIVGLLIVLAAIFGLLSRFGKQKIAFLRNNDRVLMSFLRNGRSSFVPRTTTNNDITVNGHLASSSTSELAASIHTIGERRFYVLPENQIHVIEAPPAYSDALKHPQIVPSYTNGAFQDVELNRTDQQQTPKICNNHTSPPRINVESSEEPGPSQVNNNQNDESSKTTNLTSVPSQANNNENEESSQTESQNDKDRNDELPETDENDLGIESWV